MKASVCVFTLGAMLFICACTKPGETTTMGAATGGVLGAGLGAIVGSQAGSAGTGLLVGAAAGAGAGAAVGNALEAQDQSIRGQDLAIEKQEQTIRRQGSELNELRRMGQDKVVFKGQGYGSEREAPAAPAASAGLSRVYSSGLRETDLTSGEKGWSTASPQAALDPQAGSLTSSQAALGAGATSSTGATTGLGTRINTPDCIKAEQEVRSANRAPESADKLFHFRRALRLCPASPDFHNGLGEIYVSLGRKADAEFEFKEALKLNPALAPAIRNLNALNQPGGTGNEARY